MSLNCSLQVSYLLTTNGDKGWSKNTEMTSTDLAIIREQEQIDAATYLRVANVTFLRYDDGTLEGVDPITLKKNITKWVRLYQPDLVLTFSPETDYKM
jgi:LmbE family N-acetylglucosaminyl deacetylase